MKKIILVGSLLTISILMLVSISASCMGATEKPDYQNRKIRKIVELEKQGFLHRTIYFSDGWATTYVHDLSTMEVVHSCE